MPPLRSHGKVLPINAARDRYSLRIGERAGYAEMRRADAELAAHALTDLRSLLAENESLRAAREKHLATLKAVESIVLDMEGIAGHGAFIREDLYELAGNLRNALRHHHSPDSPRE